MRLYLSIVFIAFVFIGCFAKSSVPPNSKLIDLSTYKPSAENGVLYLARNDAHTQGFVTSKYYVDDQYVGSLGDEDTYFILELTPGTYKLKRTHGDAFGESSYEGTLKVSSGFKQVIIIDGYHGIPYPYKKGKQLIQNHRFLGYQKIEK